MQETIRKIKALCQFGPVTIYDDCGTFTVSASRNKHGRGGNGKPLEMFPAKKIEVESESLGDAIDQLHDRSSELEYWK